MSNSSLCAPYDFELLPYALGDVLTWNIQTAIRCEEAGLDRVDICICADERYPASIYQKKLVTGANLGLFMNELYGAFGTHPRLGNILLFRRREELQAHLQLAAAGHPANARMFESYERAIANRGDEQTLIDYFTETLHTHREINRFAEQHGRIPLLQASTGCAPDVKSLLDARFAGRRIVPFHMRLRRLDAGYGGEHTYARDSDVLEWYEFLRDAGTRHPDVMFIAVGRIQEKPLEFLRLPNVLSLRTLGLGLGHELTLMLASDLFIGTSSGFAALANFSTLPYFITRMTPASCRAYCIEQGAPRLPFATPKQILVYEPETKALLMRLLEQGIDGVPPRCSGTPLDSTVDVKSWEWERAQWLAQDSTTYRLRTDDVFCDKETAFILWPHVRSAQAARKAGRSELANAIITRIEMLFPRTAHRFPEWLRTAFVLARDKGDHQRAQEFSARSAELAAEQRVWDGLSGAILRKWRHSYPIRMRLKDAWERKHRIPRKLAGMLRFRPAR